MPYNYDPNADPKEDDQAKAGAPAPQLAGGSQVTGGGSATNSAPAAGEPTKSGSFQNLNAYLDANSGSDFGNQFVGKVNSDVNAAQGAQNTAASQFKKASDAGATQANSDLVNEAASNPYSFSQDPNKVSAFQTQENAAYTGPQSYSDDQGAYQQAAGATQKAQDTAKAAQSEGGRFALLNNYFGTPNYNQGQKSLDNLLIQGDPTTSQGISQARQNADQAQISLQKQTPELANYASQNQAKTAATKLAAQNAIGIDPTTGTWASDPNTDYNKTNAQINTDVTNFNSAGNQSNLKTQALAPYKTTGGILKPEDYGVDPNGYLGWTAANSGNVSLSNQDRINALERISGEPLTTFGDKKTPAGYSINSDGYQSAVGQAKQTYNGIASLIMHGQGQYGEMSPQDRSVALRNLNKQYGQDEMSGVSNIIGTSSAIPEPKAPVVSIPGARVDGISIAAPPKPTPVVSAPTTAEPTSSKFGPGGLAVPLQPTQAAVPATKFGPGGIPIPVPVAPVTKKAATKFGPGGLILK